MRKVILAVNPFHGLRRAVRARAAGPAVMLAIAAGAMTVNCHGPASAPGHGTSSRSGSGPGTSAGTGSSVFPLGVWDQTPQVTAEDYAGIGITQFVGLYNGPGPDSLAALAGAGLHVVTEGQSWPVLADRNAGAISAWLQPDEPDNAQARAHGDYGPCIDPARIQRNYRLFKERDPHRPVLLGLGRGVADVHFIGRGVCAGRTDMYPLYAKGADILSFDVYPVNEGLPVELVARGVDNLRAWGGGKPVWFTVETTSIMGTGGPTPAQIKAETWLAIIHGATGITYFCHIFKPAFIEAGCLADQTVAKALKAQNEQIRSLTPVLLGSTRVSGTSIRSSVRVDAMTKRRGHATYVFAVDPEAAPTRAAFAIAGVRSGTVRVLGEHRSLPLAAGRFTDWFPAYGTHLYEITSDAAPPA